MGAWGKILGAAAGLFLGGPVGALLGAVAGHVVDRGRLDARVTDATRSVVFTIGVIALSAKMAGADGRVTRSEIAAFRRLFRFEPEEEAHVGRVFDHARRDTLGFEAYARQLVGLFGERDPVLVELLEALFQIAEADGEIGDAELTYLAEVARIFGFSAAEFKAVAAAHHACRGCEADPHHVLGVPPGADKDEIRGAYLRLVREHHPDRLIAQGLPPELIEQATARMAAVNAAYQALTARPLPA